MTPPDEVDARSTRLKSYDFVHIHGIWSLKLHRVAVACRRAGVPYIIAPRGMLEPWSLSQKWLKKRLARFLYQDRDLKNAAYLQATAQSEADQFRRLGFVNPVIISPNGVNLPARQIVRQSLGTDETVRILFMSRMHPKKGVMELVEALANFVACAWTCELVYTISGETELAYEAAVKARVESLGLASRFIFTGKLDDEAKWAAYARADLFVLPTYSENFGIVVAEALWSGIPVITTKGTPWSDVQEHDCGWWIDLPPVESLRRALGAALALPRNERARMGKNGHALVDRKYTWQAVIRPILSTLNSIN